MTGWEVGRRTRQQSGLVAACSPPRVCCRVPMRVPLRVPQEEERERRMDFVPEVSAIATDSIEVRAGGSWSGWRDGCSADGNRGSWRGAGRGRTQAQCAAAANRRSVRPRWCDRQSWQHGSKRAAAAVGQPSSSAS
jgi:hypothetical protein